MKTEAEIKKLIADAFDDGHQEGYEAGLEEMGDNYREKIGVVYAVEAFKDCITLDDFQSKYRELTNLSCTFMPTLGLKKII